MNVELSYKSARPATQVGLWVLVGGGILAVVIGAFYAGTRITRPTTTQTIAQQANPTPQVTLVAPLYPTTEVSASPTTVTSATPVANPLVSYATTLKDPLTGALFKYVMDLPKGTTASLSADGSTVHLSHSGNSLSIWQFYEAYPVEYLSVEALSSKMGTVYRVIPKEISSADTYAYSNMVQTSGTCMAMGDTLQSPCGTSAIQFGGSMNYLGIYTCFARDVSFCDNIVKSISLTPILTYQTVEMTDVLTGREFTYEFMLPGNANIVKTGNPTNSFIVQFSSGASLTATQRYEAFPVEFGSVASVSAKLAGLKRVVYKGGSVSVYSNTVANSETCNGFENVKLTAPCGLPVVSRSDLSSMTEFSCKGSATQLVECDEVMKTMQVYGAPQ